jgi:hypothetical protein
MDGSLSVQVDVHSGGDIDGVSVQGHRDRRRVGPDAWDEGRLPLNYFLFLLALNLRF